MRSRLLLREVFEMLDILKHSGITCLDGTYGMFMEAYNFTREDAQLAVKLYKQTYDTARSLTERSTTAYALYEKSKKV